MNILTDDLPTKIRVGNKNIEIDTDFRYYIELYNLLLYPKTDNEDVFTLILELIVNQEDLNYICHSFERIKELLSSITDFMINDRDNCINERTSSESDEINDSERDKTNNRIVLSYDVDAPYILGGFLECYGIDLSNIEYMHWYKFKALLDSLNDDTQLKQRMRYRSMDASKIKDKNERQRILKIQRSIAIKQKTITDEAIASVFD